jgi:hypothetical protein
MLVSSLHLSHIAACLLFSVVFRLLTYLFVDEHHSHHPPHEEPKTFADYVKPEYWYR